MSELVAGRTEYTGLQDKVLERVRERPGESPRDLASYLEANYDSVTRSLSRLNAGDKVFSMHGQYFPLYDDFDHLVEQAFKLEKVKLVHTNASRRWWRRLLRPWLGLPVASYLAAAVVGYGLGWLI